MKKVIYNYHARTGELLGASEADMSPLEEGVFLIPAHATDVVPPNVPTGSVAIFKDGGWELSVDCRGNWFNAGGQPVQIEALDADLSNLTRVAPPGEFFELVSGEWKLNEERQVGFSRALLTTQIQARLDAFAATRNYDSILSACTYATSAVSKFKTEGQACVNLRDATWVAAYDILSKVQMGERPMPASLADIDGDLPALEWPQ
jgi:hypothetical protein